LTLKTETEVHDLSWSDDILLMMTEEPLFTID